MFRFERIQTFTRSAYDLWWSFQREKKTLQSIAYTSRWFAHFIHENDQNPRNNGSHSEMLTHKPFLPISFVNLEHLNTRVFHSHNWPNYNE